MDIPSFEEIFKQIKINFWLIGIPYDDPDVKITYFIWISFIIIAIIAETAFFVSRFAAENFLELTQLAPCTCIGLLSLLKILFIALKRQNIFDLTRHLKELYGEALKHTRKRELIRQDFLFLKYLVKYFFILNAILICVYNFSTLILIAYHYYTKGVIIYILPYAVALPFSTNNWQNWLIVYLVSITCGKHSISENLFLTDPKKEGDT